MDVSAGRIESLCLRSNFRVQDILRRKRRYILPASSSAMEFTPKSSEGWGKKEEARAKIPSPPDFHIVLVTSFLSFCRWRSVLDYPTLALDRSLKSAIDIH